MISEAHRLSQSSVIDPSYSVEKLSPPSLFADEKPFWHYAPGDLELFYLEKMRLSFIREKRNVGWYGKFRPIASRVVFSRKFESPASIVFQSSGSCSAELNGVPLKVHTQEDGSRSCEIPGAGTVYITLESNEIPALGSPLEWRIFRGNGTEVAAERLPRMKSGMPPHREEVSEFMLSPERLPDGGYDAGREVFGWIEADSMEVPLLCAGESRYEAENENPELSEQDLGMIAVGEGKVRSRSPIAFRYFRFTGGAEPENVRCRLLFHPVRYRGAFAGEGCLSDLWMRSAYTLRLCMYNFLLDGIKRDRMPWAGDLSLSLLSNACVFADASIVRRTLTVLGCSGPEFGDVNGCVDFSCWLTICHELYQQYFRDPEFLRRSWESIRSRVDSLISRCDSDGFLARELNWIFIDWAPGNKLSALQILFYMSLRSAARLADRLNVAADAERWNTFASRLKCSIYERCFSEEKGLFRAGLDGSEEYTRHANLFALLSGLAEEKDRRGLLDAICGEALPGVGTPFLQGWELLAAAEAGRLEFFRKKLEDVWGYMLDQGATTFWEGCGKYASEKDYCAFYGRPYGASLCHAWSSGPVFLLPRVLMGLVPVEDGWKTFHCRPVRNFGNFCCTVPTPEGPIEASWKDGVLTLKHPESLVCLEE